MLKLLNDVFIDVPITVAARSKARSEAGILGSNPTEGMDVYLRLFCFCVC
jgi:hypothetical protein